MRILFISLMVALTALSHADDKVPASAPTAVLKPGVRTCLEAVSDDQPIKWCVLHRPFAPSEHTVSIGSAIAFNGKDDEAVSFSKQVAGRNYAGSCRDEMTVLAVKSMRPAALTAVPAKQVEACALAADSNGNVQTFVMTRRCEESIGGNQFALVPMGLAFASQGQRCMVKTDSSPAFEGLFVYK